MIRADTVKPMSQGQPVGLGDKNAEDFISADTRVLPSGKVLGTLHYVKEYKEFSNAPDEQEGNY